MLLNYVQSQLLQTVSQCVFIDLFQMAISQISMNGKTCFADDIT